MKIHKSQTLVTSGIYRYIRHPQYTGIFLIITGWLLRWLNPTILIMYPILLILYYRLARREEKYVLKEYGDAYLKYKESTPMFSPIKLPSRRNKISAMDELFSPDFVDHSGISTQPNRLFANPSFNTEEGGSHETNNRSNRFSTRCMECTRRNSMGWRTQRHVHYPVVAEGAG